MRFDILTLFPDAITSYADISILKRAREQKRITIQPWNIRDFTSDPHKTVDDTPYGGGPGMVMRVEPIDRALDAVTQSTDAANRKIVVLSARGETFTQQKASEYAQLEQLILICGRYEGIDQRVIDNLADEEVSIGPYVLAGGELGSLVVTEAVSRLIPGVLGSQESLHEESHNAEGAIEYPQYTKPATYKGWDVPDVLRSGDHAAIQAWKDEHTSS